MDRGLGYKIMRYIRLHSWIFQWLRYLTKYRQMNAVINRFLPNTQVVGEKVQQMSRKEIRKAMRQAFIRYHWDFREFFVFRFVELDHEGRMKFVPEYEKHIFADALNEKAIGEIMKDKWKTYQLLQTFFQRSVCYLQTEKDIEDASFANFVTAHPDFIVKPNNGTMGQGIQILSTKGVLDAKKQIGNLLHTHTQLPLLLEELVEQDERMGAFHKESLNTLRMSAINYGDHVEIIHPRMRFGRGKAIVDNGGAGGILSLVDAQTGIITMAYDEIGNQYQEHPDTHLPIVGFQIPEWEKAKTFVEEVFQHTQGLHYCGWDIALSTKGWVLIEGNDRGQLSFQQPTREGFRPEMEEILKKMGIKI